MRDELALETRRVWIGFHHQMRGTHYEVPKLYPHRNYARYVNGACSICWVDDVEGDVNEETRAGIRPWSAGSKWGVKSLQSPTAALHAPSREPYALHARQAMAL